MKKIILSLIALSAVASLAACGPEVTSEDKDRQQVNEEVTQQRAAFAPYAGVYIGKISTVNNTVEIAQLNVQATDLIVSNPSRNEPSAVPSLVGGLNICLTMTNCFDTFKDKDKQEAAEEDIFNLGVFNIARYDAGTNTLVLSFGAASSTSTTGGTTGGGATQGTVILNLKVQGNRLTGPVGTNMKPVYGTIDVTRK